jgi:hypothetical protein
MAYPFIPFEEIRYTSWILNNIAYRIFWSGYTMGLFGSEFITNIKKALTGLYDRDKRLKINGENFWVIEKDMFTKMEELSNEVLTNQISHTIIINIPHTIPFTLRAKIFQHCLEVNKQESGPYMHPISIRRSYIFEDSYSKIY